MSKMIRAAIVRLRRESDQQVVGVGLLVDAGKKTILTCAHVINAAMETPSNQTKPHALISLDFPFIDTERRFDARVTHFFPKKTDNTDDIAVLEILDDLPADARAVQLATADTYSGHEFGVYGFPQGFEEDGQYVEGKLQERLVNKRIQAIGTTNLGYFVEYGFSGSPVFDKQLDAIIGMIMQVDVESEKRVAFINPSDVISKLYPELQFQKCSPKSENTFSESSLRTKIRGQKQLSKIASTGIHIDISIDGLTTQQSTERLLASIRMVNQHLSYSFIDACEAGSIHDFVILYSVNPLEKRNHVWPLQIGLLTHITPLVSSFEEIMDTFLNRSDQEYLDRTSIYQGNLKTKISYKVGKNVPYRIFRSGINNVQIECLYKPTCVVKFPLKTSDLLVLLFSEIVIFDDMDFASLSPHEVELLNYIDQAKVKGLNFTDFTLDTSNPEVWSISTKGIQK